MTRVELLQVMMDQAPPGTTMEAVLHSSLKVAGLIAILELCGVLELTALVDRHGAEIQSAKNNPISMILGRLDAVEKALQTKQRTMTMD